MSPDNHQPPPSDQPSEQPSDWASSRLSDRLKSLDQVQAAQDVPEFDLDAVMRGGERRVRRRTAVGTTALAAGAGLVLALAFAVSFWTDEEEAVPDVVTTPADLVYEQRGASVVVYADDEQLARVTLSLAALSDHGAGIVEVMVDSDAAFRLSPLDFVWAGEALDQVPEEVQSEVVVDGSERLSWSYSEVSKGELAWVLPGEDKPAAVWNVGAGVEPTAVEPDKVWHLQRGDAVTVYEGQEAQAKVRVSHVAVRRGTGSAQISLTARGSYALRADDFVWSSEIGVEHAPTSDSWGSLEVEGAWGTSGSGPPLEFENVQEGFLLWAPGGKETVGVWASPEAGPLE